MDDHKLQDLLDQSYLRSLRLKGSNDYNPFTWIVGEPKIGKDTWIGAFCLIDGIGGLEIGDGCNISSGVHIITHSTVARCITGGKCGMETSPTKIGNKTFIGENATILRGCSIGDRCVIGAGSLLLQHTCIPDQCVVAGSPAKFLYRLSPFRLEEGVLADCGCKPGTTNFTFWSRKCKEHQ